MRHNTTQHNTSLRNKVAIAFFASLTLVLSACGGGSGGGTDTGTTTGTDTGTTTGTDTGTTTGTDTGTTTGTDTGTTTGTDTGTTTGTDTGTTTGTDTGTTTGTDTGTTTGTDTGTTTGTDTGTTTGTDTGTTTGTDTGTTTGTDTGTTTGTDTGTTTGTDTGTTTGTDTGTTTGTDTGTTTGTDTGTTTGTDTGTTTGTDTGTTTGTDTGTTTGTGTGTTTGTDTGTTTGTETTTGLSTSDFEKQVYIKKAETGENSATALLFMTSGAGKNYDNDGTDTFAWSITNKKLDIGTSNENINVELKSKLDNKYTFTITEPSGVFESDFFRAKPLKYSDLSGKILSVDTLGNTSCSARTLKFTSDSVVIKEVCTAGNFEYNPTVHVVSDVDNAIRFTFTLTGSENNDLLDFTMFLIEGDVSQTSTVAFISINNNVFKEVGTNVLTSTTQEAF